MTYIVFDLEFNQNYKNINEDKKQNQLDCPFEIIQIGALKVDENLQVISTFDRLIKPEIFDSMHPYVMEITGITMDVLKNAKSFKEVYTEFIDFISGSPSVLCVWGMADLRELFRNIQYHELDSALVPKRYINIQFYASQFFDCPGGTNIGLRNAVELLNIFIKKNFHDALNDADYTVEVFRKIHTTEIEPKIYNPDENLKPRIHTPIKPQINTIKLIKQFEKMFHREMTEEENTIIKLAYIMGKTNQFQE